MNNINRREALRQSALLMGYGLSATVFSGMIQGCQVDTSDNWAPSVLTNTEAELVAEIAEHILPASETPGAKEVYVHRFIDQLLSNCYTEPGQEAFRDGLKAIESVSQEKIGKSFLQAGQMERDQVLVALESEEKPQDKFLWGNQIVENGDSDFYRSFKGLCLFGYFSSETVGKEILNYDPVPGKFVGCVPLAEIGNAWTL